MSIISLYQGDDRSVAIDVSTDITGAALTFLVKVRRLDADADAVITKTIGSGITVTNAGLGLATLTLDAADTEALSTDPFYRWELQAVDATNEVHTLAAGRFVLRDDLVTA